MAAERKKEDAQIAAWNEANPEPKTVVLRIIGRKGGIGDVFESSLELTRSSPFSVALREFEKIHKFRGGDLDFFDKDGTLIVPRQSPLDLGWKHSSDGFFQVEADWRTKEHTPPKPVSASEDLSRYGRKRRRAQQYEPREG